jgi:hypothetical protein
MTGSGACCAFASAASSALNNGSPKPMNCSRAGAPAGSRRRVVNAPAEGTVLTASRISHDKGVLQACHLSAVRPIRKVPLPL